MCGSASEECNPYALTAHIKRQKILLLINSKPLSINDIANELNIPVNEVSQHLSELIKCGLVREVGSLYKPTFPIFTIKDQKILQPLIDELVKDVVGIIKNYKDELQRSINDLNIVKRGLKFPDLEYIVIGAITLDYEGLNVLSKEGILIKSKKMPGGGNYVFAGFEVGLIDFGKSLMWGHNGIFGRYWFSSHGELPPKDRRLAFPDLIRLWYARGVSLNEIKFRMIEIGQILEILLREDPTFEDLWKKSGIDKFDLAMYLNTLLMLGYAIMLNGRVWRLNIPVFTPEDYESMRSLSKRILKPIASKFKSKKDLIIRYYNNTSPARNEVPLEEAFNHIHRIILVKSLNELTRANIIRGPQRRPDGGRYSAFMIIFKK